MKIRELQIEKVRSFRGRHRLSFEDPLTGQVRPLTVIVGSNGCGKTTALEVMFQMTASAFEEDRDATAEMNHMTRGSGAASVTWNADDLRDDLREVTHQTGGQDPVAVVNETYTWHMRRQDHARWPPYAMRAGTRPLQGGLLVFWHDRWTSQPEKGSVEPPPDQKSWLWTYEPDHRWKGSLAQHWVWQNYLDLEAQAEGRPNLAPFVEVIEEVLGAGRKVSIRRGRVHVTTPYGEAVEPWQLPSGEQQILTLFGELARQMRPGAVVLIDEVEISLHPALQRKVIHIMRRLAARYDLQFIVTTHSLEIVRAVDPSEVLDLDGTALEAQASAEPT